MRIRTVVAALVTLLVSLPAIAGTYTDWWWGGSAQSGQGVNVGQQADTVFVSWFAYDEAGKGMWVVLSGQLDSTGHVVSGTFYRTTGPALGTTFDPAKVVATPVGSGTLTFSDMHHATLSWSVDGKAGTLDLIRQTFGASRLGGRYEGTTDGNLMCPGMGYGMEPMNTPVHGPITLTITAAGGIATGTVQTGSAPCTWSGTYTQSGQMVHIAGTTSCSSMGSTVMLDLTLFVLDRALVGWQKAAASAMMGMGCVQTEQFAVVRSD